jgi:hypothetical protein
MSFTLDMGLVVILRISGSGLKAACAITMYANLKFTLRNERLNFAYVSDSTN